MKEFTQINWHAIPAEEATGLLESDPARWTALPRSFRIEDSNFGIEDNN